MKQYLLSNENIIMETTAMTSEVLNDLIQINNDRIEGYEKALKELKDEDADLKDLFISMIDESHIIVKWSLLQK